MRIAVFGAGAVGGYFGGRLAQAGEDVVFIARGAHLEALREKGLHVSSIKGDFNLNPVAASDRPGEVGMVSVVLVCVKSWQLAGAIDEMMPLVGPETTVVPLLNQLDVADRLAEAFGRHRVLGGFCKIICSLETPGNLRHSGAEPQVAFGELDGQNTDRVRALAGAFSRAVGLSVSVPEHIEAAMWEKALFVAPLGGIGAVTRAPVGVLREIPETRAMLEEAMREVLAVARARNLPLDESAVTRAMALVDSLPPGSTASMQRDIIAGNPSELDAQCETVVRLGSRAGVATPLFRFMVHALLPLEQRARGLIRFP